MECAYWGKKGIIEKEHRREKRDSTPRKDEGLRVTIEKGPEKALGSKWRMRRILVLDII